MLEVARPRRRCEVRRTAPALIARVRELAPTLTDQQIAACLTAEGCLSSQGGRFSAGKVDWIRYAYPINNGCPQGPAACPQGQRGDGRYSAQAAAALLNVTVSTIADGCQTGKLAGVQAVSHGPRGGGFNPRVDYNPAETPATALGPPQVRRQHSQAEAFSVVALLLFYRGYREEDWSTEIAV